MAYAIKLPVGYAPYGANPPYKSSTPA